MTGDATIRTGTGPGATAAAGGSTDTVAGDGAPTIGPGEAAEDGASTATSGEAAEDGASTATSGEAAEDGASTAATRDPDADRAAEPRPGPTHRWFRYTLPGAWTALIFACLSFSPTLLPRPGSVQGVVCGITAAIGYGLGVLGAAVWRAFPDRAARPARSRSWHVFLIAGGVLLVVCYLFGRRWQLQIREMMNAPAESWYTQVALPFTAALVFVGLVGGSRLLRKLYRFVFRRLDRWMGERAAKAVGWVLVAGLLVLLVSGVLLNGVIRFVDSSFSLLDKDTTPGIVQPTTPLRSGGPDSLVAWNTLGTQGRDFIGSGPSQQQISGFWGSAAEEPIRTYAGIASDGNVENRARLAVADLQRAGGFDREYLLVAGTTGTGWVDPASIDALEYETRGDIASVAIQYSYLPSWVSFLVDQTRAREAGRALFDAAYQVWSDLPVDDRPKLLFFGVSLGSFSGETAFSGEADLANRTDGVLFAGAPRFNLLRAEFDEGRDEGSREVEPVFRGGRIVRFTPDPSGPVEPQGAPWDGTRVLYLQHPSDPVSWWSTDLLLAPPDWVIEEPGRDVLTEMIWVPVITFWQVTVDMMELVDVPSGHGHDYAVNYVDGWAQVIQPAGWTGEKSDQLREILTG